MRNLVKWKYPKNSKKSGAGNGKGYHTSKKKKRDDLGSLRINFARASDVGEQPLRELLLNFRDQNEQSLFFFLDLACVVHLQNEF